MLPITAQARRLGRFSAATLVAAGLAGCVAAPPPAGTQYDGEYVGQTALLRGGGFVCGIPDLPREIRVVDGRFQYPFQVAPPSMTSAITVQIAANGTFRQDTQYYETNSSRRAGYTLPIMTIEGRVAGNTMEIVESDNRCARRSLLQRR